MAAPSTPFDGSELFPLVQTGGNDAIDFIGLVEQIFTFGQHAQTGPLWVQDGSVSAVIHNDGGGHIELLDPFGFSHIAMTGGQVFLSSGDGTGLFSCGSNYANLQVSFGAAVNLTASAINMISGGGLTMDGLPGVSGTFSTLSSVTVTNGIITNWTP